MKNAIYFLVVINILILFNSGLVAQSEEDSLVTELGSLLESNVAEEKYISSASKYDQDPEEAPSSISIITAEEIESFGYQNLTEILNSQRSFYYSNDRSSDYIGVRGFRRSYDHNNRILLLLDGHRLNTYQTDYAPIGDVLAMDISNFKRIEIVRGPGSTLYGSNAVHAVINMVPKDDLNSFVPLLSFKYGSFNNKIFNLRTEKKLTENLSYSIFGTYNQSDGEDLYFKEFDSPENNNGLAVNQDNSLYKGLLATVNYKNFKLQGMIKNVRKNIPTAPFNTKFNQNQIQASNSNYIDFSWSPTLSYNKFLILRASYDYQKYWSNLPYKFLQDDIGFQGESSTIGTDIQFIWDIYENNRLILGTEFKNNFNSKYKYFTGDIEFLNDKWSYQLFSLYFQNEYQYNSNLSIYAGLRGDAFLGQEFAINPRLGIVYSPITKHTFKFLFGKSFRAPNLLERNLEEKNIVRFKKNSDLRSEFITTTELIWNYKITPELSSSVSLFNYRMNGLIDQVLDPVDDLFQYVNIGEVNANGAELEFNYKYDIGKFYLNYSYQLAKDENKKLLSNSPQHLMKFGITNKIFSLLKGSFDLVYETERRTINNHLTDPIILANVNLFTGQFMDHFMFSVKIRNVFNSVIKHPGGYELLQESIIQPNRNYLLTITFKY